MAKRNNKGFTDAEILHPDFPDPRLAEPEHRALRHQFYREQVRQKAIVPWHVIPNLLLQLLGYPGAVAEGEREDESV